MTSSPAVLGVDGCPGGGWVVAVVRGRAVEWAVRDDAAAVLALADAVGAAAVGVDVPIGLTLDGPRAADQEARARLGWPASASVFSAPVRAVLDATSYAEACAVSRSARADGRAISLQAWHITGRIADWDAAVTAERQRRVVEVHPEVSFRVLAGRPLAPKKGAAGRSERRELLSPYTDWSRPPRPARDDDGLDALVCAWTAARWARGDAELLPPDPPRDDRGRWTAIVA